MARKLESTGYFIDISRPEYPILSKVRAALRRGLKPISPQYAAALSAALRNGQGMTAEAMIEELGRIAPEIIRPQAEQDALREALERAEEADRRDAPIELPQAQEPPQEPQAAPPAVPTPLPPLPVLPDESEPTRRAAARGKIRQAVADMNRIEPNEQRLYETALMAKNGNLEARRNLTTVATAEGQPLQTVISSIIDQRNALNRRASLVAALKTEAFGKLDAARGDEIENVMREYVRKIRNE